MFLHKCKVLAVFCCFLRTAVYSGRRCGQDICRHEQDCCAHANNATCCKKFEDSAYHNIAMFTRKLSGILIMLLLFAVGYFVQRMLCSKSRTPPRSGHPAATVSQDPLMEGFTPDCALDPGPKLPTYDECKRLPTYEETMRAECGGQPESPTGHTRTPVRMGHL